MNPVRVRMMRVFRLKYHISRPELGRESGLSPQRISEIELSTEPELTDETRAKMQGAFEAVMERRLSQCREMARDFERSKGALFDGVEETAYEL